MKTIKLIIVSITMCASTFFCQGQTGKAFLKPTELESIAYSAGMVEYFHQWSKGSLPNTPQVRCPGFDSQALTTSVQRCLGVLLYEGTYQEIAKFYDALYKYHCAQKKSGEECPAEACASVEDAPHCCYNYYDCNAASNIYEAGFAHARELVEKANLFTIKNALELAINHVEGFIGRTGPNMEPFWNFYHEVRGHEKELCLKEGKESVKYCDEIY